MPAPCLTKAGQASFRWRAEEQSYTLAEMLLLRGQHDAFCAFVGFRKAFDVAFRDAVFVKLAEAKVAGKLWSVLADPLSNSK